MKRMELIDLITMRFVIGYLGEQSKPSWWSSLFFAPGNEMFLTPVFPKTAMMAQYHGICDAAARIHDEHIGIGGGVFHLFRLPDGIEQELHHLLKEKEVTDQVTGYISNESNARKALKVFGNNEMFDAEGPVRIGGRKELEKIDSWRLAAQYYTRAFDQQSHVYPYFLEVK